MAHGNSRNGYGEKAVLMENREAVIQVLRDRVQLCIVHKVRNSTRFVSCKDLKKICAGLKAVYTAPDGEAGRAALEDFGKTWDGKYPVMYRSWDSRWADLCEFFKYSPEIRKAIAPYIWRHGQRDGAAQFPVSPDYEQPSAYMPLTFPNYDAILKVLYLAILNAADKWTRPIRNRGAGA
jgi:transposase-like protein